MPMEADPFNSDLCAIFSKRYGDKLDEIAILPVSDHKSTYKKISDRSSTK